MPQQITFLWATPSLFEKQTQRAQIHQLIAESPIGMTDEEIQRALKMDGSTERPRRGELLKAGIIKDSGVKRRTTKRHLAIVWVLADAQ